MPQRCHILVANLAAPAVFQIASDIAKEPHITDHRMTPTAGRTALMVIDMQNAFCNDGGSIASIDLDISMMKAAIKPCAQLIEGARAAGIPIIYTRYVFRADYADGGGLEPILNGLDTDSLIVCGVTTNCCVETTVRDASQRDYKTFVVTDATGELERERHDFAINIMAFLFAEPVTVDDVLQFWR